MIQRQRNLLKQKYHQSPENKKIGNSVPNFQTQIQRKTL